MGIGFQLERELVVNKGLWTLAHTGPAVIEESTGLGAQESHQTHVTYVSLLPPQSPHPHFGTQAHGGTYKAVCVLRA